MTRDASRAFASREASQRLRAVPAAAKPNRAAIVHDINEICRGYGPGAVAKLADMAGLTSAEPAQNEAVRLAAIREMLDRGFGKPTQQVLVDGQITNLNLHLVAAQLLGVELAAEQQSAPRVVQHQASQTDADAVPTE